MIGRDTDRRRPGRGWLPAAAIAGLLTAGAGQAQRSAPAPRPAPVAQGVAADTATATRLIWWAMAAVDQANQTGNYSVLRDLGVPSFQANNSAATLAGAFQAIRGRNLDLSALLTVIPTFETQPAVFDGLLRARGVFPVRPVAIGFDLLFQNVNGRWALFAISVVPLVSVQQRDSTK